MEHSFDIEIAVEYGVIEAILLKHLYFWIKKNEANEKNKHDGYYWTYNSMKAFGELFPYVSERKIRNALKHLEAEGLLITGNYNKSAYDRTMWYALTEKGFSILQKRKMENSKKSNQNVENVKPIPDINTDKEPDKEPYIYIQDAEKQTSESKNSAPEETIESVIAELPEELQTVMREFVEFRNELDASRPKLAKTPFTVRACKMLLTELNKLSDGDTNKAIEILQRSIINGWKGVFPLPREQKQDKPRNEVLDMIERGLFDE